MKNGFAKKSLVISSVSLASILCGHPAVAQTSPPLNVAPSGASTQPGTPNPRAVSMYNLGLAAYRQGSPESAIIFFKRACDLDPNLADAQYNLAVIYQAQKRLKDAVPRFEEVLRIKPTDPDAHYQIGVILADLGRYPEAKQHLNSIAPNNVHFNDAQKKLSTMGDQSAAGQNGYQAPPQGYQQQYQQPPQGYVPPNPVASGQPQLAAPMGEGAPQGSNYAPPQQPWQKSASATQPLTTADLQSIQSTEQPNSPEQAAAPSAPSNPIPVLANASLRVIATGFSAPAGLAFDKTGNLYIANYMTNSIERIAPDGTRSPFSSGVNLRGPIGLIVDDGGNLYVANYHGGTVARINAAGVSTVIATGFKKPYYLTLDRDGNLYVSQQEDNSIVRITLPKPSSATARTP